MNCSYKIEVDTFKIEKGNKGKSMTFTQIVIVISLVLIVTGISQFGRPSEIEVQKMLFLILPVVPVIIFLYVRGVLKDKNFYFKRTESKNYLNGNFEFYSEKSKLQLHHVSKPSGKYLYTLRLIAGRKKISLYYNLEKKLAFDIANDLAKFLNVKIEHEYDSYGVLW